MIVVVTPNPALDMTWTLPAVQLGDSHRVHSGHVRAGGKGINVARVLHGLGHAVLAIAPHHEDGEGAAFSRDLAASGVPAVLVPVDAPTRRSIAIVEDDSGRATLLNEQGAALLPHDLEALRHAVRNSLSSADLLVISGSLPPATPAGFVADLIFAAHARGIAVIADVAGAALREAAAAGADLVKPNLHELREATEAEDPRVGIAQLLADGARLVAASFGSDGLSLARRTPGGLEAVRARLPRPLKGNATGAGDAAVAALAAGFAIGETDLFVLARSAAGLSASAVLMPLAGEISPRYDDLIAAVIVENGLPLPPERTSS